MPTFHRWTADLVAISGLSLFAAVVVREGGLGVPGLRLVALPVLLFAPGYALISLLFPEDPDAHRGDAPSLGLVERFGLAVALSVGIVPMIALGLNFTSYGVRAVPVAAGVAAFVLACSLLALFVRSRLSIERRFDTDVSGWMAEVDADSLRTDDRSLRDRGLFDIETRGQRVVTLVLVVSVLVFGASIAFAATVPESPASDERFTEFYLLGENESGTLSARAVPTEFEAGGSRTIHVGIENQEQRGVEYTTVVLLQRVSQEGSEVSVQSSKTLDQFSVTVGAGDSEEVRRQVAPSLQGDDLRLVFLLYEGEPPGDPSVTSAYRSTQVWITVGGDGGSTGTDGRLRPGTGGTR